MTVTLLWLAVFLLTMQGAATGKMFYAPCLSDLRPKSLVQVSSDS